MYSDYTILRKLSQVSNGTKALVGPDGNAPPYPTCKEGVLLLN